MSRTNKHKYNRIILKSEHILMWPGYQIQDANKQ